MAEIANYTSIYQPNLNKAKELKTDEGGYRRIILGAFNIDNSIGIHYPLTEKVKKLFEPGGSVRRRLDTGLCKSEMGHPDVSKMQLEDALRRISIIDETRVCAHIKSVQLVPSKDEYNSNVVMAVGWVKPSGPYANGLENQFNNPEENVAFSIRSFVKLTNISGKLYREVTEIFTWDYVSEPGIKLAHKFNTLAALESHTPVIIEDINLVFNNVQLDNAIDKSMQFGFENEFSELVMVRDSLGWNKVQSVNLRAFDW